jgi:hypothetical protein
MARRPPPAPGDGRLRAQKDGALGSAMTVALLASPKTLKVSLSSGVSRTLIGKHPLLASCAVGP